MIEPLLERAAVAVFEDASQRLGIGGQVVPTISHHHFRAARAALSAVTDEELATVLAKHVPCTGMTVAAGVTCICGYWNGVERPGVTRPVGLQGLQWHHAQVLAAYLRGES